MSKLSFLPLGSFGPLRAIILGLIVWSFTAPLARAGVTFHNLSAFNAAVAGMSFRGVEDWASATGVSAATVSDPLLPSVLNGPFPTGSKPAVGIRAQSNSLGNNPANPSPGGGMFYGPAGYLGVSGNAQPTKQLSAAQQNHGFDLILTNLAGLLPRAVSLSPMYYRIGPNNTATLTVRVYNQANQLLGSTTVAGVQDCLENAYVGIVATGYDTIGRINVWATAQDVAGADNIRVYDAPPLRPTLLSLQKAGNKLNLFLSGQPGQSYAIYSTSNLVHWVPERTNVIASSTEMFSIVAPEQLRFYHARWLP
jgi:hypothetical protein